MNTLIHLWPETSHNESAYAILDTPMFPARFYFGPVGNTPDGWIGLDNATNRFHRSLADAECTAMLTGFSLTSRERTVAQATTERADLLLVTQRLAALRSDAGFAEAVSFLPELAALVDQAECVIAGKPFDAAGYAGGGS